MTELASEWQAGTWDELDNGQQDDLGGTTVFVGGYAGKAQDIKK
jgi:hypothetical protein